ncbi:MAG TPA: SGNH/GDSL hydrolase family protein [Thermoanaerobaculia bacterium]
MRALLVAALTLAIPATAAASEPHWVVSWGASPVPPPAGEAKVRARSFAEQTLREIVHLSLGGKTLRLRLSNLFGRERLEIAAAHVALRTKGAGIAAASDRVLTFGGASAVAVPPNAVVASDPVRLTVPAGCDLAISLYLRKPAVAGGLHEFARQTSYVGAGDQTAAAELVEARPLHYWAIVSGVDVVTPPKAAAVAVFGDSFTDGDGSTEDANRRWTDALARRLAKAGHPLAVLNAGIAGNRVLRDAPAEIPGLGVNALARFERDALDQPGVRTVVLLEGNNDFGLAGTELAPASEAVSADELIGALKQLVARAHERGVRIVGATLPPFEGADIPGYSSPEKEARRQAVNAWIRAGRAFDGVIDVDRVVRDPAHPARLNPALDSGDHLHPGDAGYQAVADAVGLGLFR